MIVDAVVLGRIYKPLGARRPAGAGGRISLVVGAATSTSDMVRPPVRPSSRLFETWAQDANDEDTVKNS